MPDGRVVGDPMNVEFTEVWLRRCSQHSIMNEIGDDDEKKMKPHFFFSHFGYFGRLLGVHEARLERQGHRMGYITVGCVSEWAWSRLLWLPAGFGAWNPTKSSHVSVASANNLCHSTFCGQPKCLCCCRCCCCCCQYFNWLEIISHQHRMESVVLFSNTSNFGSLELFLIFYLVVYMHYCSFLSPLRALSLYLLVRLTDTNGFRNWIWDGMRCQPCLAWCSIAVAFNSQPQRLVDGTCRQKSVAEIYVTWIGGI